MVKKWLQMVANGQKWSQKIAISRKLWQMSQLVANGKKMVAIGGKCWQMVANVANGRNWSQMVVSVPNVANGHK